MSGDIILQTLLLAIILAISIGLHEYAHAWASNILGDPTPKLQGRLTPNPLAHLDPMGFFLIFLIHFGRGKPVIINPHYYKNPRIDEFLVAMAGPASNILMAICGLGIMKLCTLLSLDNEILRLFRIQFSMLNIGLALFNLLPFPPLDGWKIIKLVIGNYALRLEFILGTNPLLMIVIFVIIGRLGVLSFISNRAESLFYFFYHSIVL